MNLLPPPGPQRRRQLMMLGLLLVVLTVVGWRYLASAGPAPAPQAAAAGPQSPAPAQITQVMLPAPVSLDKLEGVAEVPENGRNLFRFGEKPAPPPVQRPVQAPAAPPPVATPPPVWPPPIALKLIGITTGGDGRPVAVLKDPRTGATFMGSDGMIVDGQYKIVRVAVTSVQISYADGTGLRTIPLGS